MEASGVCGLCQAERAPYTCPRCHVRFCSVPCYREHGSCARDFQARELQLRLRDQPGDAGARGRLREALLRLRELREPGDAGPELGLDPDTDGLWEQLTPQQRQGFQELLSSGEISGLLPPWKPWWVVASQGGPPLVQLLGDQDAQDPQPQQEGAEPDLHPASSRPPVAGEQNRPPAWDSISLPAQDSNLLPAQDSNLLPAQDSNLLPAQDSNLLPAQDSNLLPAQDSNLPPAWNSNSLPARDSNSPPAQDSNLLPARDSNLLPALPDVIRPLSELTGGPVSPLVRFQLPNALYAYAYALSLYNGEADDAQVVPEVCETLLDLSDALGSRRVFSSTGEALQAALQAVADGGYPECPLGKDGAMEAVGRILRGEPSPEKRSRFTLAAFAHLARILARGKRRASPGDQPRIYKAKKKCEFLLSWAKENEEELPLLSLEVQREYVARVVDAKEVGAISQELEKMWGGKVPPCKQPLIEELD